MNRIAELKEMHKTSKPELIMAIKNTRNHMEKTKLDLHTRHIINSLITAVKSYDEVIDELFAEIDRLKRLTPEREGRT